jgi:photosystem II stability/assembly factor-like uncharacterized protein
MNLLLRSAVAVAAFLQAAPMRGETEDPRSIEVFDDFHLRSIGPAVMGGRIDVVAAHEDRPWVLYIGAASGGVWKSVNMGTTWQSIFDGHETSSIGDIAIAPSDPEILWVGTGEPNNRQSSSFGYGVYKSEDGGATFQQMGLERTGHIGQVVVHPRDPGLVYVAALGPLWAPGGERGVFRTRDSGKSWERVLFVDQDTGAVDLAMDPKNPDVLYAALYQRRRVPWGFSGGGMGGGLYKTTDGGGVWKRLENGLPKGPLGRIGVDLFRSDPRIVYAIVEHKSEGGVYRSTDRGESWAKVSSVNPRPMYYSRIFVDPTDAERVYVLGSEFFYSDDGGITFVENEEMTPTYDVGVHGDHHTLWIDPKNSHHLVLGGDGGLYVSWDRGRHWDKGNNIPLAQFYSVAVDMEDPYNVYAGAQDNHSWFGPSATRNYVGILNQDWRQINFGDGMYQQADPTDGATIFTSSQGGNIVRLDRRTGDRKSIRPHAGADEDDYRFHWTSPILVSRQKPGVLYLGGNRLFTSTDRGDTWLASPELTWNEDRDELPIMGSFPDEETLSRNDGVDDWGTLTTIAESPLDAGILYAGTDDGRVQVSRDGGKTFEALEGNVKGFDPKRSTVSRIVASHASKDRAYVSFDRHQLGDFAPYVFVTEDFGRSFRPLDAGLPRLGWVNVILEHPRNPDLLLVGTETGLFVSFDRGLEWLRMGGNFPTVPVDDLVIHPRDNDLVVGTHGRSIYILDDVTALERHRARGDAIELFDVRKSTVFLPWKHESYGAQRQFVGENPEFGALITYHLVQPAEGIEIQIADAEGGLVRKLGGPAGSGFQRVAWDLRAEGPKDVPRGRGPLVPPGRYGVSLVAGSERRESFVEVVLDPRLPIEPREFEERYRFLQGVNELRARLQEGASRGSAVLSKLEPMKQYFASGNDVALFELLESTRTKIEEARKPIALEGSSFRDPSLAVQAGSLFGELEGTDVQQGTLHGPTPVQHERLRLLEARSQEALRGLEDAIRTSLEELNSKLEALGPMRIIP